MPPTWLNWTTFFLYTIDDLQEVIRNSLDQRQRAAQDAELIVNSETSEFLRWLEQRQATEIVQDYRRQASELRDASLNQAQRMLAAGQDPQEVLRQLANQLTNRLLHQRPRAYAPLLRMGATILCANWPMSCWIRHRPKPPTNPRAKLWGTLLPTFTPALGSAGAFQAPCTHNSKPSSTKQKIATSSQRN
ncbi:MAG: hypothetical protein HC833_09410 [Leptolyngbyaceae cyanobacterium RM1_406_9]|nr:hypothetical protein [Leptolyngbyaceae cyanobacterium RM1_406_9]